MSYLVLARTWRPQTFDEVVGQPHVTQTLKNAIQQGRVAHAYLFSGPRGVGKTSMARILAKSLNCETGPTIQPCGRCSPCREIREGISIDVQEIDGASNRGIEEVRELRENARYLPAACRYKIYIIDEVHMLTKEAFNALLKILEEPPPHVLFVFATTEMHRVPATILSRCQKFLFRRVSVPELQQHLQKVAEREGFQVEPAGLALLVRQADGSVRDALSLLDQVISCGEPVIRADTIRETLGLVDRAYLLRLIQHLLDKKIASILEMLEEVYRGGYDLKQFYYALLTETRALLYRKIGVQPAAEEPEEKAEILQILDKVSPEWLQAVQHELLNLDAELRYASFPRLVLELGLLRIAHLSDFYDLDSWIRDTEEAKRSLAAPPSLREERSSFGAAPDAGQGEHIQDEPPAPSPHLQSFQPERLLDSLARQKPTLGAVLKQARMEWSDNGQLVIALPDTSRFNAVLLEDSKEEVEAVLSKEAGKAVRIRIRLEPRSEHPRPAPQENLDEPYGQMQKEAMKHPMIQEIKTIFKGEVVEYVPPTAPEGKERLDG